MLSFKDEVEKEAKVEVSKRTKSVKHLEFKNKYRKLLLRGLKKTTVRANTSFERGDIVYVHCGGEIIGEAKILEVEERKLEDLTNEIAISDGFKNAEELIKEIRKIYGNIDKVYVINFDFKPFKKPKKPEEMYYGELTPVEIAEKALNTLELDEQEKQILELLLKTKSIKKTAIKLGGVWKRKEVREILRRCYKSLKGQEE